MHAPRAPGTVRRLPRPPPWSPGDDRWLPGTAGARGRCASVTLRRDTTDLTKFGAAGGQADGSPIMSFNALVEGVPADRTNTRRGPCGRGRLPQYPWELDYESHGYCGCDACCDDMGVWRIELVNLYDPELTCNVCPP